MEYRIVSGSDKDEIESAVRMAIDAGWRPVGGLAVMVHDLGVEFYQAMVRGDR